MQNIVFIADIHSQYDRLSRVLDYYYNKAYLVFLGDINDTKLATGDFYKTYIAVRAVVDSNLGCLVQSNHQYNLIRVLRGQRKNIKKSMVSTLDSLQARGFLTFENAHGKLNNLKPTANALELADWLDARPLYFESEDGKVVAVHAQYTPEEKYKKFKNNCMYGRKKNTKNGSNERDPWYLSYKGTPHIVAGHYHYLYKSQYCTVIDGGCGSEKESPLKTLEWPSRIIRDF